MKTQTHAYLRWLNRNDVPDVLDIAFESFGVASSKDDFIVPLQRGNCIGMVAEVNKEIAGYVIYELRRREINLLSLAVHPKHRRSGVGRTLVEKLSYKLDIERRKKLLVKVRERNLDAQLFFRSMGFLFTQILKEQYEDSAEDAYLMEYLVCD